MEPHHFFTAQRVLIVAGKGGVGKSAVSGALAHLSARSGLRTLLVSLDPPTIEVPQHELLERITVSPGNALTDYLSSKGMGLLSRQLAKSGIVELVATTAPGLDDLLVLGRIKAFERELRADVIIVDGPAAGHATDLVRAPRQLKRAIGTGPIAGQADEVLDMLADANRCKILMVTTPAMTPVTETLEAITDLQSSVDIALAPIVVNKREIPPPVVDESLLEGYMRDAYGYVAAKESAQSEALALLQSSLDIPLLTIARRRLKGSALIELMANDLETSMRLLP
jgi:arsenite-transporting ATPase